MSKKHKDDGDATCYCSFCGKSQEDVAKLIAGPAVYICDECIELCNEIVLEGDGLRIGSRKVRGFNRLAQ